MGRTAVAKKTKALVKKEKPEGDRVQHWKKAISETWQYAVESIISTGEQLIEAKEDLKGRKGAWTKLCDNLPFKERTAQMLMKVAASPQLSDPKHASLLPPSWYSLYQLTQLDEKAFKQAMAKGKIFPGMERSDVEKLIDNAKPKIDRNAEDAEEIAIEDDNEPEGDDDDEPEDDGDEPDDDQDEEDGDDNDRPEPSGSKDSMGHVAPRLSRHDKKVDFVHGAIEVLAQRLGEFEEMLDGSQEVRDNMKSKMSRDMLKRAQEVGLIIERLTKKYLKG